MRAPGLVRPRTVALLGLLVLLASLLPWWRHDVAFDGPEGSGTLVEAATAWGASWGWAAAVVCAAVAGALALLRRPRAAAALAAAGVVLLAGPLLLAVSGTLVGTPESELTYETYELTDETYDEYFDASDDDLGGLYAVQRGQLLLSDEEGYRSGPGVGLYAGGLLLLAQAVVAVQVARRLSAQDSGGSGAAGP